MDREAANNVIYSLSMVSVQDGGERCMKHMLVPGREPRVAHAANAISKITIGLHVASVVFSATVVRVKSVCVVPGEYA